MVSFIVKQKPRSIQAKDAGKTSVYKSSIQMEAAKQDIKDIALSGDLYAKIFYFHAEKTAIDADNLSKPIIDALKGQVYVDDNIITLRTSGKINISDSSNEEFDITNIPANTLSDLLDAWDNEKHFLYIEIGKFTKDMIIFGERICW